MPAATLIEDPNSSDVDAQFEMVDVSRLQIGSDLETPIYDEGNVLLLAAGHRVTGRFLELLQTRGIGTVRVHESELAKIVGGQPMGRATTAPASRRAPRCTLENAGTRQLDELVRSGASMGLPPQGPSFAFELTPHGNARYDDRERLEVVDRRESAVSAVRRVIEGLASGTGFNVDVLTGVTEESLDILRSDPDLFASLGVTPVGNAYPAGHSLHTAMVAMSIGARLGLDLKTLRELALGCLVHDAGMLGLEERVYQFGSTLTQVEFLEITKHPVRVFDMMVNLRSIPHRSAIVAYQIHERCDGSGYPRRRDRDQIHLLSKIAAVADAYVGLVSPRPHREALQPYHAVKLLLEETRFGRYEPTATRGLLEAISLFPIGSYVELDDGRVGRTIRANGAAYDRPIVEVWDPDAPSAPPSLVNLVETTNRRVVSVADSLDLRVPA